MRHNKSVFHQVLQHVPRGAFDRQVKEHEGNKGVRSLPMWTQFIALAYGQLSGASSLREIEQALQSHAPRLDHVNAKPIKRSTLADANATRPAEGVYRPVRQASRCSSPSRSRRALAETTYLIDLTSLKLNAFSADWAQFSAGVCGAKAHVILDADAVIPVYMAVSAANVNDISAAKEMPIEAGATYVFDLGYYDYSWWAKLDKEGCRIVARLKFNTPLEIIEENPSRARGRRFRTASAIPPARQAKSRKNPFQDRLGRRARSSRLGKVLRLFSNDLDASAEEIAALYKRRWGIELFFRWIKQNLKIKEIFWGHRKTRIPHSDRGCSLSCIWPP